MDIKKIIYIEDNAIKRAAVMRLLGKLGSRADWAKGAEGGLEKIRQAHQAGEGYSLILLDMHFPFFGKDDPVAGEKTMRLIREMGVDAPIAFCSSQNWKVPGSIGTIWYNEYRDWEREAIELLGRYL
ncbi:MAG: hypothetical protein NC489_30805 [Ruminococcus flavefaciens]|nr:hypothetical protein [Ruminococcus flavefaciens]